MEIYDKIFEKIYDKVYSFGNPYDILPQGLISFIVASGSELRTLKGPFVEYDYTDYTYANGEVALGDPDGVELWDDPTTQYVDENNYSTYDAETGIGRIVSDGTYVTLSVTLGSNVGDHNRCVFELIGEAVGKIRIGSSADPQPVFPQLGSVQDYKSNSTYITITRHSACDVTFKLSVQQLEVLPAVDDGSLTYTNELPEGAEDFSTWSPYDDGTAVVSVSEEDDGSYLVAMTGEGNCLVTKETTVVDGETYNPSIWLKGVVGGEQLYLALMNGVSAGTAGDLVTLTDQWVRYYSPQTADGTDRGFQLRMMGNAGDNAFYCKEPMLAQSNQQLPYIAPGETDTIDYTKGVYGGPGYTNEFPEGSEDFNDTDWVSAVYSVTEETTIGGIKAYKLETLAGVNQWNRDGITTITLEAGKTYTVSYLVKKGNINNIAFRGTAESTKGWLAFDLDSGEVGNMYDGTELLYSNPTIIPEADGYRIGYTIEVLVTEAHHSLSAITYNTATEGDYQYISSPMVVESSYQFPYIPPGATQPECGATSGGNGLALELSGERADGVELLDPTAGATWQDNGDGSYTSITTNWGSYLTLGVPTGSRYLLTVLVENASTTDVDYLSGTPRVSLVEGLQTVTIPAGSVAPRIASNTGTTVTPISIQKLEPYISPLKECFQGEPDGVELVNTLNGTGAEATITVDAGVYTANTLSASSLFTESYSGLVNGDRYLVKVTDYLTEKETTVVNVWNADWSDNSSFTIDNNYATGVITVVDGTIKVSYCSLDANQTATFKCSLQKLNPVTMTMAALVTMGVDNEEPVSARKYHGLIKVSDADANPYYNAPLYYASGGSLGGVVGTNPTPVTNLNEGIPSFSRGDRILFVSMTDETGENIRVGYWILNVSTSFTWTNYSAFSGTFDPEEFMRLALVTTTQAPIHIKFLATFDYGEVPEATLLKLLERYK